MTDSAFWIQRWQQGRIGWHVAGANPLLTRYWDQLDIGPGANVLVPLSGRSDDLSWLLSRGYRVDAVELAEQPIREFFENLAATPERGQLDGAPTWRYRSLRFVQADFLALDPDALGRYDAVYDRAALIAVAADRRAEYVRQIHTLCAVDARQLLITLEYAPELRPGPPFSVGPEAVTGLYAGRFQVNHLLAQPDPGQPQSEHVFALRRRPGANPV